MLFSGIYFLSDSESNFWDKFNFGSSNSTSIVTDADGLEADNATDDKTSGADIANNSEGKGAKGNSNVSSEENTTTTQGTNLATTSDCVIIVGMFSEQANVDKLIGKIESQGFKAYTKQRSRGTQLGIYTDCSNTSTVLNYAKNNIEKGSFLKRL